MLTPQVPGEHRRLLWVQPEKALLFLGPFSSHLHSRFECRYVICAVRLRHRRSARLSGRVHDATLSTSTLLGDPSLPKNLSKESLGLL